MLIFRPVTQPQEIFSGVGGRLYFIRIYVFNNYHTRKINYLLFKSLFLHSICVMEKNFIPPFLVVQLKRYLFDENFNILI